MASSVTVEAYGKKVRTSSSRRFVAVGIVGTDLKVLGRGDTGIQAQDAARKRTAPAQVEFEVIDLGEKRRMSRSEKAAEGSRKAVAATKEKSGQKETAAAEERIEELKNGVKAEQDGAKTSRTKIESVDDFEKHLDEMKRLARKAAGGPKAGREEAAYELRKKASTAYYFGDRLLKAARSS